MERTIRASSFSLTVADTAVAGSSGAGATTSIPPFEAATEYVYHAPDNLDVALPLELHDLAGPRIVYQGATEYHLQTGFGSPQWVGQSTGSDLASALATVFAPLRAARDGIVTVSGTRITFATPWSPRGSQCATRTTGTIAVQAGWVVQATETTETGSTCDHPPADAGVTGTYTFSQFDAAPPVTEPPSPIAGPNASP